MKTKKIDLDIDYIGGQGELTETEEKALTHFFKQRKMAAKASSIRQQVRTTKRPKASV